MVSIYVYVQDLYRPCLDQLFVLWVYHGLLDPTEQKLFVQAVAMLALPAGYTNASQMHKASGHSPGWPSIVIIIIIFNTLKT